MSKRKRRVEWTTSDIHYLEMNFENTEISIEKIMKDLNRSKGSIYTYARNLGLSRNGRNVWSEMEDEYLKANYERNNVPYEEVCKHLNRHTATAVHLRIFKLGLGKRVSSKWTEMEDEYLKANYEREDVSMGKICKHLRRYTKVNIIARATYLGLSHDNR